MPKLNYLFTAKFTDGSIIRQNSEDKSSRLEGKNCYYDVLETVKEGKTIEEFMLTGKGNKLKVNLLTGMFEVNGVFLVVESIKLPAMPEKFDLVWYHQVTQNLNVTYKAKTGDIVKAESQAEIREYFIGWKCNIRGKEYISKIAVA